MKKVFKKYFVPHEHNEYKPHFLREKSVLILGFAILAIFVFSLFQHAIVVKTNLASIISSVLVDLVNHDRENNNLSTLTINPLLTYAAQMKANDMAAKGYFSHTSPDGLTPWHWFREAGYRFVYAGENLAVNFYDSGNVENAWMNSLKHRENILNSRFTEIGIATAKGMYQGKETIFVVQLFGSPAVKTISPIAAPAAIPTTVSAITPVPVATLVEEDTFIAVKGEEASAPFILLESARSSYSSFPEKLAVSPKKTLLYSYLALAAMLFVSLALFIVIEIRKQYPRHIIYALMLIFLMAGLFYANNNFIFPELLIK